MLEHHKSTTSAAGIALNGGAVLVLRCRGSIHIGASQKLSAGEYIDLLAGRDAGKILLQAIEVDSWDEFLREATKRSANHNSYRFNLHENTAQLT